MNTFTLRRLYILFAAAFILNSCGNDKSSNRQDNATVDSASTVTTPKPINFSLVAEYPHDPKAFTEGLEHIDGFLYESIGKYGSSDIRKTDLKTGNVLQSQKLDAKYFGEGITVLNGKIYQLTYQEKTGFVYDFKTMKLLQTFSFPNAEGWGMTHDSANLIYSDGSDKIFFMDPKTFKEIRHIDVKDQYGQLFYINELEYIHGYIYANQWKTDTIYKIDPETGNVVGVANMKDLRMQGSIPEPSADESAPEVMNGIAYDAANNRIFVTGKNWPKVFEIRLDN